VPKRKQWQPPAGRMNEKACRTQIRIILRDLSSKSVKLTGGQRYRLHERVAQLQEELRLLEIEKLERQEAEATKIDGQARDSLGDKAKLSHDGVRD